MVQLLPARTLGVGSSEEPEDSWRPRLRSFRTWAWGKPGSAVPSSPPSLRERYPLPTPFRKGHVTVSKHHQVYFEQYGNPHGVPALVVHGGPGAGCFQRHATFFNPELFNIVLLDQRGCGSSTPAACLVDNNTDELVQDMEKLRKHLEIHNWVLLGGSWGVALSLAYAIKHPNRVLGMVLRGVCLMRTQEIDWVFGGGCKALVPQAWDRFLAGLTEEEHAAPLQAYYRRLTHPDDNIRRSAAAHWSSLERSLNLNSTDKLQVWRGAEWTPYTLADYAPVGPPAPNQTVTQGDQEKPRSVEHTPIDGAFMGGKGYAALAQAILTCHYSVTAGSGRHGQEGLDILSHIDRIRHIPTVAVHGRQDVVCPIQTAWDLHSAWPEMELQVVPGSGHSMYEPAVTHCLLNATDRMARLAAALN